jgi:plastocyanin
MAITERSIAGAAILLGNAVLAACGGYDGGGDLGGGPDPAALSAARSEPSGNAQTGLVGQDLATPLRIVIRRGAAPTAGAVITWSANGTGSAMTPAVDTTGADGISTSVWHLGDDAGVQNSRAVVVGGADGSPVAFTATASDPGAPAPVQIQLRNDGGNNRFEPANVTVPLGTTVTWSWVGGFHDVTPTGDPVFIGSGPAVPPPNSYSHTFNSPGTFLYFCSVHGTAGTGMHGTIEVR